MASKRDEVVHVRVKGAAKQALAEVAQQMDVTVSEAARLALAEFVGRHRRTS